MIDLEKAVVVVVLVLVILVDLAADLVVIVAVLKTLVTNLLKVIFVGMGWVGYVVVGMILKELITRAESTTPAALWVLGTMHLVIILT